MKKWNINAEREMNGDREKERQGRDANPLS